MPASPRFARLVAPLLLLLGGFGLQPTLGLAKEVSGLTEPFLDVTLSSPVSGIIRAEQFKEGDPVKKGEIILELDKKLEEFEATRRKEVLDHSKADMESTRVLFTTTKAVSRDEMDKKETEYNVAQAEYGIALEQLNRREIKAPFDGSISEVFLHSGAACGPYQQLVRLVDTQRCYFVGYVDATLAGDLKLQQAVKVNVDGAKAPIDARICFISPVIDPASGLARVKALFENPGAKIRPGVAAKMQLEHAPAE